MSSWIKSLVNYCQRRTPDTPLTIDLLNHPPPKRHKHQSADNKTKTNLNNVMNCNNVSTDSGELLRFNILDLPTHILFEVLSRLPVWSILCCTCVCRVFRNTIKDPNFQKLYVSRAPISFLLSTKEYNLFFILCNGDSPYPTLGFSSASCLAPPALKIDEFRYNGRVLHKEYTTRLIGLDSPVNLVNSCNGFLCLYNFTEPDEHQYFVCNPILGEFVAVPPLTDDEFQFDGHSAFGLSAEGNEYKIVHFGVRRNKTVAEIYTLGDQSWKLIRNAPSVFVTGFSGTSSNGVIHGISRGHEISEMIFSFDLDTEDFQLVAPPGHLDEYQYKNRVTWYNTGVSAGCLCFCYIYEGAIFESWVMNRHGGSESWTRMFTIDMTIYCGLWLGQNQFPIGFTDSGEMWLASLDCDSDSLVCYSPMKQGFTFIDTNDVTRIRGAVPHIPSFVSLRDVIKNKHLKHLKFKTIKSP